MLNPPYTVLSVVAYSIRRRCMVVNSFSNTHMVIHSRQYRLRLGVGTGSGEEVVSFTGSLPNRKRWVVCNAAFGHLVTDRQTQQNFGRNPFHSQGRIVLEAKPIVEGWLANQDTPLSPQFSNRFQALVHKCLTNPLSLERRKNGNRPDCKDGWLTSIRSAPR